MITADVRRAIWDAAGAVRARPALPADDSSLRPAPDGLGSGAGRYASTLPYLLAAACGASAGHIAETLADRLGELPWIAGAAVTGTGYLTVTVTGETLTSLAVRIVRAGVPACASSDILRAMTLTASPPADLAAAAGWADASARLADEVTATMARAAGAVIPAEIPPERRRVVPPPAQPRVTELGGFPPFAGSGASTSGLSSGSKADFGEILALAGPDTIRYALLAQRPPGTVRRHLGSPAYAVLYAHAHAASTLRQAADLGLIVGNGSEPESCLLASPAERALLGVLSWLPERVAGAARRRRPRELTRYLEELAAAYYDCRERCPALRYGGRGAPCDARTSLARLWLVAAARTALAAGLDLLGVSAPDRL